MKNYYAILEVPVGCSLEEIRQAYRRLVQENLDSETIFAELKEAYEVLTTPERRAQYDLSAWGETFAPGMASAHSSGVSPDTEIMNSGRCPMGAEAQCPVLLARVTATDKFCPECGYLLSALSASSSSGIPDQAEMAAQPRLEEPGGQTHRLRPGLNLVGRESADVLLPDKTVSRQHARLEVGEDDTVTVEDLSSTNGTQLNGDHLVPHVPRLVSQGDQLRFGSVLTQVRLPNAVPAQTEASALSASAFGEESEPPAEARAKVVDIREDDDFREFYLVPGVTTFGRRAENSIVLLGDPYVSGSHAQIIAEEDVFRLTDVGSTNGTLLNGERMAINEPATLSPGDVILIGGTALRFELIVAETEVDETETSEPDLEHGSEAEPSEGAAQIYEAKPQDAPLPAEG